MAQTIVIEQGDKNLQNVTKITPDTPVNLQSDVKYPTDVFDGTRQNSMVAKSWTDEDEITFTNPHILETESSDDSGSDDDGEG